MDRRRQPGVIRAVVTSPSGLDGANKIFSMEELMCVHVFPHLDAETKQTVAQVCKPWKEMVVKEDIPDI